jgi:hypothetical protein
MLSPFASLRVNSAKHLGIFSALFELTNAGILRFALQKLDALLMWIEQLAPSLSDPSSACN